LSGPDNFEGSIRLEPAADRQVNSPLPHEGRAANRIHWSQEDEQSAAKSHDEHIRQRNLNWLCNNLHDIIHDLYLPTVVSLRKYETHMTELQIFTTRLPEELQYSTVTQISGMSDEQKSVIVRASRPFSEH
jgi:hypothetical protein